MSEPAETRSAPVRRGAAKLDAGKLGDVLAGKGEVVGAPAGAEQRGASETASPSRPAATAQQPAEANRRAPKGISTSLEVPPSTSWTTLQSTFARTVATTCVPCCSRA
jgi:hypothetical protein